MQRGARCLIASLNMKLTAYINRVPSETRPNPRRPVHNQSRSGHTRLVRPVILVLEACFYFIYIPPRADDAQKLYRDYGQDMRHCVDLTLLARTADPDKRWRGKYNNPIGLARLVEVYLYRLLEKGKITRSNWEADLQEHQIECESHLVVPQLYLRSIYARPPSFMLLFDPFLLFFLHCVHSPLPFFYFCALTM